MLRVERLSAEHNRKVFACGEPALDTYIRQKAGQDERRDFAACYILTERVDGEAAVAPTAILGYYTLSMSAIVPSGIAPEQRSRLPRYEVYPAALLGRLAVDLRHRGQRYGELLLIDAMRRTVESARSISAHALVVDALNAGAVSFYLRYGFRQLLDRPERLYLPLATCREVLRLGEQTREP